MRRGFWLSSNMHINLYAQGIPRRDTPPPKPPDTDRDKDDNEAPATPPTEPEPVPVEEPPSSPGKRGPYVVRHH